MATSSRETGETGKRFHQSVAATVERLGINSSKSLRSSSRSRRGESNPPNQQRTKARARCVRRDAQQADQNCKGVRDAELRAAARREMATAKDAVPVWIMPLAEVADSFTEETR